MKLHNAGMGNLLTLYSNNITYDHNEHTLTENNHVSIGEVLQILYTATTTITLRDLNFDKLQTIIQTRL